MVGARQLSAAAAESCLAPDRSLRALLLREVAHRIGDRVAMLAQRLRLHPFVQKGERAFGLAHGKVNAMVSLAAR